MATHLITGLLTMSTFAIYFVRPNEWNYRGDTGPNSWSVHYPDCGGENQSPINIVSRSADTYMYTKELGLTLINYDQPINGQFTVMNIGHQVQVGIPGGGVEVGIDNDGRSLRSKYTLAQFHFHWGSEDSFGSEHSIDNNFYAMEIHLVHYNSDLYPDFATAANKKAGLVVLAVLVGVNDSASCPENEIDALTRRFSEIPHKGDVTMMPSFCIRALLPASNLDYFRYSGSLTAVPCYESVTWFVFRSQVNVTPVQMKRFRTLLHSNLPRDPEETLVNNVRPIQSLNGRIVSRGVARETSFERN